MIDKLFVTLVLLYLKYKLHQLKGGKVMKCTMTLKGFSMNASIVEADKPVRKDGENVGALDGTSGTFNFEVEETTSNVEMTEEEFIAATNAASECEKFVNEKVVAPFMEKLFDTIDKFVPLIEKSITLNNDFAKESLKANAANSAQ